jgi:hypothetical protein
MACKCISYNRPQPWQREPEQVLETPEWAVSGGARQTVCVDACIADAVRALWSASIWTYGSCCGHGEPSKRTVIVDMADRKKAREVLDLVDDTIRVGAWELIFDGASNKEGE